MIRKDVNLKGDARGYIGRRCPKLSCNKFFKIKISDLNKRATFHHYCPYCGLKRHMNDFLTSDQKRYIKSLALQEARKYLTSQLEDIINRFPRFGISFTVTPPNLFIRHYTEKILNNEIICPTCNYAYLTTEPSFFCPNCGILPPISQWGQVINEIETKLDFPEGRGIPEETRKALKEGGFFRNLTEATAKDLVTGFEAYCKPKFTTLLRNKFPPSISDPIIRNIKTSFQNLDRGNRLFTTHLGYDYRSSITNEQFSQLNLIFQKRHILTHSNGMIDQQFIRNTQSNPNLLGQRVTLKSYEISQAITYLKKIVEDIEKIS